MQMRRAVKIDFDDEIFSKVAALAGAMNMSVSKFVELSVKDRLELIDRKSSEIKESKRNDDEWA